MLSQNTSSRSNWLPWILSIVGFWLSGNLVIDFLVMPVMQVSGMTTQADFASAGYAMFWSFNRIELLCAAMILTGVFALRRRRGEFDVCQSGSRCRWALMLGLALLCLTLVDTYVLAPQMSAMAISLNAFNEGAIAPSLNGLHGAYFLLEILKLTSLALLAQLCFLDLRNRDSISASSDLLA